MSNLLEQAIIDANALRETALKSAESALIEKYKDEFKDTVEKLLEQEEAEALPPETVSQSPDISPEAGLAGEGSQEAEDESLKDIPSSFLDGDDDELITIDFDKIEKQLSDVLSSPILSAPDENEAADELGSEEQPEQDVESEPVDQDMSQLSEDLEIFEEDLLEEESSESSESSDSIEEEVELEEDIEEAYDHNNTEGLNIDALTEATGQEKISSIENMIKQLQTMLAAAKAEDEATKKVSSVPSTPSTSSTTSVTEDFELTEEDIQELSEEMKVDIEVEGLLDGHMGTHQGEKREIRNMELAAARDECAEDDREEESEKLGDLKKELQESQVQNKKYSNLIEELKDNLIVLKEQTEKLSISNAKLLYINKVFANNSLNERQKQNIVESISKAGTVLEAKTIYGTLQSAVEGLINKKSKESLSEALNRDNTVFTIRQKTDSTESPHSERLKILAGIINK